MGSRIILAPVAGGKTVAVSGNIANLKLGDGMRKCFIQDEPMYLLDYHSGFRIPSIHGARDTLNAEKIYAMATSTRRLTDRQAAQLRLDTLVARVGVDEVLAVMNAAPTINKE